MPELTLGGFDGFDTDGAIEREEFSFGGFLVEGEGTDGSGGGEGLRGGDDVSVM